MKEIHVTRSSLPSFEEYWPRPYKDIDEKIRFERISFLDKMKSPTYQQGENIRLRIDYLAKKELHDFAFRVVIQTPDKVRIGMAMTERRLHAAPGRHSMDVEFPIDWLAPGRYDLSIVTTSINDFGTEQVHDRVYFKTWTGPTRPEFRGDIDMSRYTGNQKWLIWCLEQFLNSIDE